MILHPKHQERLLHILPPQQFPLLRRARSVMRLRLGRRNIPPSYRPSLLLSLLVFHRLLLMLAMEVVEYQVRLAMVGMGRLRVLLKLCQLRLVVLADCLQGVRGLGGCLLVLALGLGLWECCRAIAIRQKQNRIGSCIFSAVHTSIL